MLDQLKALFSANGVQKVGEVIQGVSAFVKFLETELQGEVPKVNEAIEHVKALLDTHKK